MAHYPGYTVLRTEDCPEQHGTLTLLTHDVSGAAVLLVENEDVGYGQLAWSLRTDVRRCRHQGRVQTM